jgi:hypothetical protein
MGIIVHGSINCWFLPATRLRNVFLLRYERTGSPSWQDNMMESGYLALRSHLDPSKESPPDEYNHNEC